MDTKKIKLLEIYGISLYIHWSWFLLPLLFAAFQEWSSVCMITLAFFFVSMHEYGHCLMAKVLGLRVKDIVLYPIGGVATIHFSNSITPLKELLVVIAGPAVNFVIFMACIPFFFFQLSQEVMVGLVIVMVVNLILFGFNMLPIFPMDGGKVVRAFLWFFMDHYKATYFMVRASQFACVVLAIVSLMYSYYWGLFMFPFLCLFAQLELAGAQSKLAFNNLRAKLAKTLEQPNLVNADFPELIAALEGIEDKELREKVLADDLIVLFREIHQEEAGLQESGK